MIFDWVVLLLRKVSCPVYNRTLLSSNIISQYCDVLRKILLLSKPTYSPRFCCVHVKGPTRIYNMIRRILQTEQHEHHKRPKDKHVPTIWYAEC
jgi:hypothetical protein